MPNLPRIDLKNPAEQEKIRRGPHQFVTGEGYVPLEGGYRHQEYPKVMDHTPAPKRSEFARGDSGEAAFAEAKQGWDQQLQTSIVHNEREAQAWLKAHPQETEQKQKPAEAP